MSDLSDPKGVKKSKDKEKQKDLELEDAVKFVMSDKRGRFFLRWLLERTSVGRVSHVMEKDASRDSAFYEGMRNIGNVVVSEVENRVPNAYLELLKEMINERRDN